MNVVCPYGCKSTPDLVAEGKVKTYKCRECKNFFEIIAKSPDSEKVPFTISESSSQITKTSKESYKEVLSDGTARTQITSILAYLASHPNSCIREISEGLGIQKSSISARLNELKKEEKITFTGTKTYRFKTVETWAFSPKGKHDTKRDIH